ncbi:hypothetical protein SVAN01_08284 [Stagonosporopsis vannaccii]|nr:hypothetical protein SVAN01_08284 [Stagonosporopsis vannaccii]
MRHRCTRIEQTRRKWIPEPQLRPNVSANSTPDENNEIKPAAKVCVLNSGVCQTVTIVIRERTALMHLCASANGFIGRWALQKLATAFRVRRLSLHIRQAEAKAQERSVQNSDMDTGRQMRTYDIRSDGFPKLCNDADNWGTDHPAADRSTRQRFYLTFFTGLGTPVFDWYSGTSH